MFSHSDGIIPGRFTFYIGHVFYLDRFGISRSLVSTRQSRILLFLTIHLTYLAVENTRVCCIPQALKVLLIFLLLKNYLFLETVLRNTKSFFGGS